ncbi:MAG: BMC domain-containing protein [Desulfofundulus sp.]|uniref:BMC domain-containing protein n=1 Tax=Desulfofundulus sp. TaxID=2282750 RepID=UPI003C7325FB
MLIRLIKSPSPAVLRIIAARRPGQDRPSLDRAGAIALIQGQLADILLAADLAEKAAAVEVDEVRGSCPQHMTMIAVWGDTAAVQEAVEAVKTAWPGRESDAAR